MLIQNHLARRDPRPDALPEMAPRRPELRMAVPRQTQGGRPLIHHQPHGTRSRYQSQRRGALGAFQLCG